MNWYLRFPSEAVAHTALSCLPDYNDDDGNPAIKRGGHCNGPGWHARHIGPHHTITMVNDEEVVTTDARHHVNVMITDPALDQTLKANVSLATNVIFPATPSNRWNGGVTDVEPDFWV